MLLFRHPFSFYFFKIGKYNFIKKLDGFFYMVKLTEKEAGKPCLGKYRCFLNYWCLVKYRCFVSVNQLNWLKASCWIHHKRCYYLPPVWTFEAEKVLSWGYVRQRSLVNIQDEWIWNIVTQYCSSYGSVESKIFPTQRTRNRKGSILPVVPLRLDQFNYVRIPLAHRFWCFQGV